ncbi:MAG: hypothetical protein LBQ11_01235 [Candidatus Nomurabacteria bacterium]|jgi:uncharacterized protein Yka (UPF0111/DUF47 family)|nr:hypothetical protein [Candidatus Nomurabacteria bacterium]
MNDEDRVKIIAENIDDQFAQMGEVMDGMLQRMDRRFDEVDQRLNGVDQRLDRVDGRLDKIEERLDNIEDVIAPMTLDHNARIIDLEKTTKKHGTQIAQLKRQTA